MFVYWIVAAGWPLRGVTANWFAATAAIVCGGAAVAAIFVCIW